MSDDGDEVKAIPVPTVPTPTLGTPTASSTPPTKQKRKSKRKPVSIEHAVEEGLMIARSALTMEVKNRIIVEALADGRAYDELRVRDLVRRELIELADENREAAARMRELAAAVLTSRGAHTREGYQAGDHDSLADRATIHTRMSEQLRELSTDDTYLDEVAERARERAWSEVGDAIQSRLIRTLPLQRDKFYEEEKAARIQALYDINLRALEKKARKAGHHRHQTAQVPAQAGASKLGRLLKRKKPSD